MKRLAIIAMLVSRLVSAQILPLPDQGGVFTNANANTINSNFAYIGQIIGNVTEQGAKADVVVLNHCITTSGSKVVTCSDAHLTAADKGKAIAIQQGVSSSHNLYTTITTIQNTTAMELQVSVSNGLSDISAVYGTDNLAAFKATVALHKSFSIPTGGGYYLSANVPINYPEFIFGGGQQTSIFCMFDGAQTAFTFDATGSSPYNTLFTGWQVGMSNILMIGPGFLGGTGVIGSASAIQLGGSINAIGAKLENITALYFNTGLTIAEHAYYNLISGSFFKYNRTDLHMTTSGSGGNGESTKFISTQFQSGGTDWGLTDISDCVKLEGGSFEWTFDSLSFVNCQIHFTGTSSGKTVFNNVHMEEIDGTSTQDMVLIDNTSAPGLMFYSPDIDVGRPSDGSGPAQWITLGQGAVTVFNGDFFSYKTGTPAVVAHSNHANGSIRFYSTWRIYSSGFSNYVDGLIDSNTSRSYIEPDPDIAFTATPATATQSQQTLYCIGGTAAYTLTALPFKSKQYIIVNSGNVPCVITGNAGNILIPNGASAATFSLAAGATLWLNWVGPQWYATLH